MAAFDLFAKKMNPATRNRLWQEIITTENSEHQYHGLNTTPASFKSVDGEACGKRDFYAPTWAWIDNKYTQAAGCPSQRVTMARAKQPLPVVQRGPAQVIPGMGRPANMVASAPVAHVNSARERRR